MPFARHTLERVGAAILETKTRAGDQMTSHSLVWTPARTSIPRRRTLSAIEHPARTARAGPSNDARKPSPAVSISRPR